MPNFIKKLLTVLLAVTITLNTGVISTAHAEENYFRIIEEGVYFYLNPDLTTPLFELPYSYFVKKIGYTGDFLHVECYGNGLSPMLDGYVLASSVVQAEAVVDPFLSLTVTTANSTVLYTDRDCTIPQQYIFKSRVLGYYGRADENSYVYYVNYNDKIGYVKEESLLPFAVPLHILPVIKETTTPDVPDEPTEDPDTGTGMKILIIASLIIATGLILTLIAIPERREKSTEDD